MIGFIILMMIIMMISITGVRLMLADPMSSKFAVGLFFLTIATMGIWWAYSPLIVQWTVREDIGFLITGVLMIGGLLFVVRWHWKRRC